MLSPDRFRRPCAAARPPPPTTTSCAAPSPTSAATGATQPEIDAIAEAAGVTPTELHHLFRRWAGLTPKAFLQALTLDSARKLLRDSASVLDASYEVGLSGPGRLHDLFVTHEAMSPGEWKAGGEGLTIYYGFHPSPVRHRAGDGDAARARGPGVRRSRRGARGARRHAAAAGRRRAMSRTRRAPRRSRGASSIQKLWQPDQPLRVVLIGTDFEVRVWETLLRIPMGRATTYSDIAGNDRQAEGARARSAPRSARIRSASWCRAIACIGKSGDLTGYHWGLTRKRAMLGWEAGVAGTQRPDSAAADDPLDDWPALAAGSLICRSIIEPAMNEPRSRTRRPVMLVDPRRLGLARGDAPTTPSARPTRRRSTGSGRPARTRSCAPRGRDVGLPAGQMGNSEVGHLNIGAGRVVMQDLPRIGDAIATGEIAAGAGADRT